MMPSGWGLHDRKLLYHARVWVIPISSSPIPRGWPAGLREGKLRLACIARTGNEHPWSIPVLPEDGVD
jgi:hypothetical protein